MNPWAKFKEDIQPNLQVTNFFQDDLQVKPPSNAGGLRVAQPQSQPLQVTTRPTQVLSGPVIGPPPAPKNRYIGFDLDEGKNKTIFGWNAAALLPKGYEKTYGLTTGREFESTEKDFLSEFDNISDQFRNKYVNDLQQLAQDKVDEQGNVVQGSGDQNALRTLQTLERAGKLKGDFNDFIEGSNERFLGGLTRGTARAVDFVLPGKNTFGLEAYADSIDAKKQGTSQVTEAGRAGETAGTVQKGAFDIASLVVPSAAVDKAVKGVKIVQGTSKGAKAVNYGARLLPGSATGTAIDIVQEKGRGNEVNLARNIGIGTAADLITPAVFKGIGKGKNKIASVLSRTSDDAAGVIPTNQFRRSRRASSR